MTLLLIPQRYEFSSKSQPVQCMCTMKICCCWYHKGTNFQANHNFAYHWQALWGVVADTTKVRIFKQITTESLLQYLLTRCCWYHKGTNFQANHNDFGLQTASNLVVADTTKVRIFKQITTVSLASFASLLLLLIPQRYEFSSKSQLSDMRVLILLCCCWYHKGTNFQANHNLRACVVILARGCCWYHKGTNFQANHNSLELAVTLCNVVADTTKVRIFKQITTFIY